MHGGRLRFDERRVRKSDGGGHGSVPVHMPAELWDVDTIKATSVISYDNARQSGYLVGQYAAEKLGGEGKILFISGNDGHWTTSRREGFMEAVSEYPAYDRR